MIALKRGRLAERQEPWATAGPWPGFRFRTSGAPLRYAPATPTWRPMEWKPRQSMSTTTVVMARDTR
ncbi:MAG: hypothetical protein JW888_10595 [Pirellulales bacterium]|nr:hypothetical protein [Pirellulales bacterium]